MIPVTRAAALKVLVERYGYTLMVRHNVWFETFAWSPDCSYRGVGPTEAEAIEDVLMEMNPSRLSRALLNERVERLIAELEAANTAPETPTPEQAASSPPEPAVTPPAPEPTPEPILATNGVLRLVPEVTPVVTLSAEQREQRERQAEELNDAARTLIAEMDEAIEAYARMSPFALRLRFLALVCWIRHYQSSPLIEPKLYHALDESFAKLRTIVYEWWPGSIPAMLRAATPRNSVRHLEYQHPVETWEDAAKAAEEAFDREHAGTQDSGLDEFGWTAEPSREVFPDADKHLDDLYGRLMLLVEDRATMMENEQKLARMVPELLAIAACARAIRPDVSNPRKLSTIFGIIRQISEVKACNGLKIYLNSEHVPPEGWAIKSGLREKAKSKQRKTLATSIPTPQQPARDLAQWLMSAMDVFNTDELTELLGLRKDTVLAMDTSSMDRRQRRRIEKLKGALGGTSSVSATEADTDESPAPISEVIAARSRIPDTIVSTARVNIAQRSILMISDREHSATIEQLENLLGTRVVWYSSNYRQMASAEDAVLAGKYGVVLTVSGFVGHHVTHCMRSACRRAGIPCLLVNGGSVHQCINIIAQQLRPQAA